MLALLNISNFALISALKVEFEGGLNLLTGETGSGKSIIVDALGVLIGDRFTAEMIRAGETHALALPAGEHVRIARSKTLQADAGKPGFGADARLPCRRAGDLEADRDVLERGLPGEQRLGLK